MLFFDEVVLALKRSGVEEYALFVNETKYGNEIKSHIEAIQFLSVDICMVKLKELLISYLW
ncbi:MAG: hypothetical protein IPH33_19770 [Bacteroidetes bacterium]|nr:hypothetical protein [Bacteroidota bacterium]